MTFLILLGLFVTSLIVLLYFTKSDWTSKISARIILDSINEFGQRLVTFEAMFNRFLLAELNTHRMLSRNAASSRAIPIQEMLRAVLRNPAPFVFWGRNQAGMQAAVELTGFRLLLVKKLWFLARFPALFFAWVLYKCDLHKQSANRLLEPWLYTTVIVSGTEWDNFFKLRAHPAAQPEFQDLAFKMLKLYENSVPKKLEFGEWHLPLITSKDWAAARSLSPIGHVDILRKISVARCARVSYIKQNLIKTMQDDFNLHDRLSSSGHWSPSEHVAMAGSTSAYVGNFAGWVQHRKTFPNESGRKE